MYRPVEFVPSPALLSRSNLMATLLGIPAYPSPPPSLPSAVGANILNRKSDAVGGGIGQLEGEIGGELLDIDRSAIESAAGFIQTAVGQLQPEVVQVGAAVELDRPLGLGEALAEVDGAGRMDRIGGAHHRTGEGPGATATAFTVSEAETCNGWV